VVVHGPDRAGRVDRRPVAFCKEKVEITVDGVPEQ